MQGQHKEKVYSKCAVSPFRSSMEHTKGYLVRGKVDLCTGSYYFTQTESPQKGVDAQEKHGRQAGLIKLAV